jgi:hypothetical protein
MVAIYSVNKNIYSVDLMIAYVNIYKPKFIKVNPNYFIDSIINYKGWGGSIEKNIIFATRCTK